MSEQIVYIYKITFIKTNKIYVGQTTIPEQRLSNHFKRAREIQNKTAKCYNGLYIDMIDNTPEDFSFELLDTCFYRHRFILEKHYIELLSREGYNLYNINHGAEQSDSQKEKARQIAEQNKARYQTESFKKKMSTVTSGEKNGMYGRKGEHAVNGQQVFKLDENNNIIETFNSVQHALQSLGIKGHSALMKACKNHTEYKGFYWSKTWSNR